MSTTVKEHLRGLHERAVEHHTRLGKLHREIAARHEGTDPELSKLHQDAAAEHEDFAAYHGQCAEACSKAVADELNKLVPTSVSVINRDPGAGGSVLFTRAGQPPRRDAKDVPDDMKKFVEVETEDY